MIKKQEICSELHAFQGKMSNVAQNFTNFIIKVSSCLSFNLTNTGG